MNLMQTNLGEITSRLKAVVKKEEGEEDNVRVVVFVAAAVVVLHLLSQPVRHTMTAMVVM